MTETEATTSSEYEFYEHFIRGVPGISGYTVSMVGGPTSATATPPQPLGVQYVSHGPPSTEYEFYEYLIRGAISTIDPEKYDETVVDIGDYRRLL